MAVVARRKAFEDVMLEQSVSQAELARRARLDPATFNKMLSGRRSIGPRVRRRLLDAVGAPLNEWRRWFELTVPKNENG